jgi:hypothetical protein
LFACLGAARSSCNPNAFGIINARVVWASIASAPQDQDIAKVRGDDIAERKPQARKCPGKKGVPDRPNPAIVANKRNRSSTLGLLSHRQRNVISVQTVP